MSRMRARQARGVAGGVIATVALMAESGLPCYGRGAPVENLRKRFRLDLTDAQAADFMRQTIADAYDKVRCCRGTIFGPPKPHRRARGRLHAARPSPTPTTRCFAAEGLKFACWLLN